MCRSYHGVREGVNVLNVPHAVLPGDQALNVDVQLIPDGHDGFVVLLVPVEKSMSQFSISFFKIRWLQRVYLCAFVCKYLLARLMLRGLGGGMIRHTDGMSMSNPPGPVTFHLQRSVLFFRIPVLSFRMPFCNTHMRVHTVKYCLPHKR